MIKFISTNCLPNLYIYLWPEKLQNHVTSFSEITMENDWWLLILRNHSQWKIVQWSRDLVRKHPQKQVKNRLGCFHLYPYQGFSLNPLGAYWLGRIFCPSILLKSPPIKSSENTDIVLNNYKYIPVHVLSLICLARMDLSEQ